MASETCEARLVVIMLASIDQSHFGCTSELLLEHCTDGCATCASPHHCYISMYSGERSFEMERSEDRSTEHSYEGYSKINLINYEKERLTLNGRTSFYRSEVTRSTQLYRRVLDARLSSSGGL